MNTESTVLIHHPFTVIIIIINTTICKKMCA